MKSTPEVAGVEHPNSQPIVSADALLRLAQPRRQIQMGAHSRPIGLESARSDTTPAFAASSLPDLQQTHGAHRPFGQGASDLEEMTHRPRFKHRYRAGFQKQYSASPRSLSSCLLWLDRGCSCIPQAILKARRDCQSPAPTRQKPPLRLLPGRKNSIPRPRTS